MTLTQPVAEGPGPVPGKVLRLGRDDAVLDVVVVNVAAAVPLQAAVRLLHARGLFPDGGKIQFNALFHFTQSNTIFTDYQAIYAINKLYRRSYCFQLHYL